MKVLILKPSSLGDVIQALPVLRLLKLAHPDSEADWWLATELLPLLEGDPHIHRLIPFNRRGWWSPTRMNGLWRTAAEARGQRYDLVIDLQGLLRSAAFGWLVRGRHTIGVADPREGAPAFYDVSVDRPSATAHAVDWYLEVARVLGLPVGRDFDWLPERPAQAAAVRSKWPVAAGRWALLCPGARWENKRWPAASFAALSQALLAEVPDLRIAVLGGRGDQGLGEVIAAVNPGRVLNLCGQTSLAEMIEWARLGAVMVTNDTGPMHVAAALGRPVVGFFGPTSPARTGPYGQTDRALRHPLPCAPCFKKRCTWHEPLACLHALTPSQVLPRVLSHLASPVE